MAKAFEIVGEFSRLFFYSLSLLWFNRQTQRSIIRFQSQDIQILIIRENGKHQTPWRITNVVATRRSFCKTIRHALSCNQYPQRLFILALMTVRLFSFMNCQLLFHQSRSSRMEHLSCRLKKPACWILFFSPLYFFSFSFTENILSPDVLIRIKSSVTLKKCNSQNAK